MWIIDRFENETALCETEDGGIVEVPRMALPPDAREGSCLRRGADGAFTLDHDAEAERRRKLFEMQRDLFG